MYKDETLLPISALQHLAFCARQCALIHIEGYWSENALTAQGRVLHEKTHEAGSESRAGLRIARGLRLRSRALGLTGVADVVEFHETEDGATHGSQAAALPGVPGRWRVFPVEYKRGRPKHDHCDIVQLCAQALCLEEMLGASVSRGAIFYGKPRRRMDVELDSGLREETTSLARRLHEFIAAGVTPPPESGKHCRNCSLNGFCLPDACAAPGRATIYLQDVINSHAADDIKEAPP